MRARARRDIECGAVSDPSTRMRARNSQRKYKCTITRVATSADPARRVFRVGDDAENWLRPVVVNDEAAILRAYTTALRQQLR
ncbi:hypothetical protein GCM10027089_06120 [Nocardia thraciensis]